jgi:hypothetical protein
VKVTQLHFFREKFGSDLPVHLDSPETLVLVFFSGDLIHESIWTQLVKGFPRSMMFGCSGGGAVKGAEILDSSAVVSVIRFERSRLESGSVHLSDFPDSFSAGRTLASSIPKQGLKACYVLSDGLHVNGSALVQGLRSVLGDAVDISGGLAAAEPGSAATYVLESGVPKEKMATILGLYGNRLNVVSSVGGGWKPFGLLRKITRSKGNILHTLDGKTALGLYREFLGEQARNLPGAALLFPLYLAESGSGDSRGTVRTVIGMNESEQSMTFAGDVPEGSVVQLMRSSHEKLIDAAGDAGGLASARLRPAMETLCIVASCVGRRMVLGEKTDQEIELIQSLLPHGASQTGFYSNGEIGANVPGRYDLHNQSIAITLVQELELG